ncbi:MAG: nucleotidyltransferase domain-containing protein [Candidatus Bipolaricaulia bacterium]
MSNAAVDERKELLECELDRILNVLIRNYQPEKVLVFGSLARGEVGTWSDLDLIVIKRTQLRFLDRIAEVIELIDPHVGIDVLVYTPEEFEQLQERPSFRDEVLTKGKVLYERV